MFESARKKIENYHRAIGSEQKQKYFEQVRTRMMEAQRNSLPEEEHMFEMELMSMFESREDYERTMALFQEYELEEKRYKDYMEHLEEESNNFLAIMMEQELKRKA
jgi:hypothetical protein